MKKLPVLILIFFILVSCSKETKRYGDSYIIRYVDLARVYAYAFKLESGRTQVSENDETSDAEIKKRIYGTIKTAISDVARRHNTDFILNTGDAVLYSRPSYDITDDVIREYKKIIDISTPDIK